MVTQNIGLWKLFINSLFHHFKRFEDTGQKWGDLKAMGSSEKKNFIPMSLACYFHLFLCSETATINSALN